MTMRRIQSHEECLRSFAAELKREVKSSLAAWRVLDPQQAAGRRAAYASVFFLLTREAERHGIPLADLGLVDYEVPRIAE
jgi:hypothetical protein